MSRLLVGLFLFWAAMASAQPPQRTGPADPAMQGYDRIVSGLMMAWDVPGAAVAVTRDGKLVYSRGFGHAGRKKKRAVRPDSLFRIASLSKPITAVAVLKLVEQGRIDLDSSVLPILGDAFVPPPGRELDPRWNRITIRHLLLHGAGFDRQASGDPMFYSKIVAAALETPPPADADTVIRYMLGRPLDFDPGTRYVYSNFGYCVLGRVIERVTGESYETYVREAILRPMGITSMRIGRSLRRHRAPGEVNYHDEPGAKLQRAVFPQVRKPVLPADGGFHLEAMDAHGGWIASAVDLARFLVHVDGRPDPPDILKPETLALMAARPDPPLAAEDAETWYGLGWQVRRVEGGLNLWHTGALSGSTSLMVRAFNGLNWVVLYNRRGNTWGNLLNTTDAKMWEAALTVETWPARDLFEAGARGATQ